MPMRYLATPFSRVIILYVAKCAIAIDIILN